MNEETKINALVNIGQSKIVEKVYDDTLSEPSKKAGEALGTIINIGNTLLWPIKWANERTRIFFQNNLKRYEEKLDKIPEEKITEVPTEISMPILERFTYTSNEELSNAFVNLLASASSTDNINKAHPGFIYVIDRLSPDEALILKYLVDNDNIPMVDVRYHEFFEDPQRRTHYVDILKDATLLEKRVTLKFPENVYLYLDNLVSLGLIHRQEFYYPNMESEYTEIQELYKELLDSVFDRFDALQINKAKSVLKRVCEKTEYCRVFIEACIKD